MIRVMILGVRAAQVGSTLKVLKKKAEAWGLNLQGTFSKKLPSVVFYYYNFLLQWFSQTSLETDVIFPKNI